MGKMTTYILVMSGLMLMFYFAGQIQNTGNSTLLNLLLDPASIANSPTYAIVITSLEIVAAAGVIIVGVFTSNAELAVMSPLALYFLNLGWDFLAVFNKTKAANPVIAILIFSPIIILYVITIVEWWRGRD